jgi:hypothetical protein
MNRFAILLLICATCPTLSAQISWPRVQIQTPTIPRHTNTPNNQSSAQATDTSKSYTYCMVLVLQQPFYVTSLIAYTNDVKDRTNFRRLSETWKDYSKNTLHLDPDNAFCNTVPTTANNMSAYRERQIATATQRGQKIVEVNWTLDLAKEPAVQAASLPPMPPPNFKSAEAKACWTYFMASAPESPQGTAAAVAACQKSGDSGPPADPRVAPFRGDPVAQSALGLSYLTGNRVPFDKAEGLKWLEVAARGGGGGAGQDCSRPAFPPAMLMAGVLLWNGNAWWNTDTFHMVWAQPGEHWTNAKKWISMNQGKLFVSCASHSAEPAYAELAERLKKQMPDWEMPRYDPQTSGTSTTSINVRPLQVGDGKATPQDMILLVGVAFTVGEAVANVTKNGGNIGQLFVKQDGFGGCTWTLTETSIPCQ